MRIPLLMLASVAGSACSPKSAETQTPAPDGAGAYTSGYGGYDDGSGDGSPYDNLGDGGGGDDGGHIHHGKGGGGSGAGDAGAGGSGGQGSTANCTPEDVNEPNQTEPTAKSLGDVGDDDDDGGQVSGVLAGMKDVDWFKYDGSDDYFSTVDPTRSIQTEVAVQVCAFIQCKEGTLKPLSCPSGTQAATSPEGRKGCCGGAGFTVSPDCGGNDDSASVYLRVSRDPEEDTHPKCLQYTLKYHF